MDMIGLNKRLGTTTISPEVVLLQSQYLKLVKDSASSNHLVYHSLFGNLHYVSEDCVKIIDLFSTPMKLGKALEALARQSDLEKTQTIIEDFISSYYLVPKGFDERILTKQELSKRSESLESGELINAIQLNVSEGCNLKCAYCFADRVDERSSLENFEARNDKKFMSLQLAIQSIEAITELIRRNGNNALMIKFFGREPLLNWAVVEQVINYCETQKTNFNYYYAITTNGTLFTSEIINKLKQTQTVIVVSLDGFAEANLLRVSHSGSETFSMVDKGLSLLKQYDVTCSVASVLSEQNFKYIDEDFLNYLQEKSVIQWEVKLAMQNDGSISRSPSEYAEKLLKLYTYGEKIGIKVTGDWYDPFSTLFHTTRRSTDNVIHRLSPSSCSATDHQISVEPSGNIFGCRALDTRLGKINTLNELLKSSEYKNLSMRTYYNVPLCHGCKLEGFCQGVCLGHSERKFNNIYAPDDAYCNIYRAVFDLLLANYFRSED
jgi:radical SAM protein with 4Fe4S-binding SPASM domain